jgi:hypothetical protein
MSSLQKLRLSGPNIPDDPAGPGWEKLPFSVILSAGTDVGWAGLPMMHRRL